MGSWRSKKGETQSVNRRGGLRAMSRQADSETFFQYTVRAREETLSSHMVHATMLIKSNHIHSAEV